MYIFFNLISNTFISNFNEILIYIELIFFTRIKIITVKYYK